MHSAEVSDFEYSDEQDEEDDGDHEDDPSDEADLDVSGDSGGWNEGATAHGDAGREDDEEEELVEV